MKKLAGQISALDWTALEESLNTSGYAVIPKLLTATQCRDIAGLYADKELVEKNVGEKALPEKPIARFRSRIVMQHHHFGRGEYKYFAYPLPDIVATLRSALYPHLADVANRWHRHMKIPATFPPDHEAFIERCHGAGQTRPTPLLIQYVAGDYNCLHQDLYGGHVFPLQAVALLAEPGRDFTGGELVLTEQRPRMQSRVEVLPLAQGDVAIFAVQHRPVSGATGSYRANMRHGVSQIRSGLRHTLGIIFHDAA